MNTPSPEDDGVFTGSEPKNVRNLRSWNQIPLEGELIIAKG